MGDPLSILSILVLIMPYLYKSAGGGLPADIEAFGQVATSLSKVDMTLAAEARGFYG